MEKLIDAHHRLLEVTDLGFKRYLYGQINWQHRLIAILGARGTGKTTLMLQRIKEMQAGSGILYVSADNIHFSNETLLNLAERFHALGGTHLFIDEIHKYPNWSQEVKNIYDSIPRLNLVITGSSVIDMLSGYGDLSRRSVVYHLHGLSLREYIGMKHGDTLPTVTLPELLEGRHPDIGGHRPLQVMKEYLSEGYYPFFLEGDVMLRLHGAVNAVFEVDLPKHLDIRPTSIDKLKRLLAIIAASVPFRPNFSKLSELTGISRNLLPDHLLHLEKAGLIHLLHDNTGGIRGLGKLEKVYLSNTVLMHLFTDRPDIGTMRETFLLDQLSQSHTVRASETADLVVGDTHFEVGGRNKGGRQLKGLQDAYLVKDDVERGFGRTIPLWYFGFLY
jgi:uncharacterized protein